MATSKRPFRVLSLDGGGVDLFSGAGLDGLLLLGVPVALIVGEEDREGDDCALSSLKRMRIVVPAVLRASAPETSSMSKPVLPSLVHYMSSLRRPCAR